MLQGTSGNQVSITTIDQPAIPWWFLGLVQLLLLSGLIYLSDSISPLIVLGIIGTGVLILMIPESALAIFLFIGLTKGWIEENIALFQSIDYSIFLFVILLAALAVKLIRHRDENLPPYIQFVFPLALFTVLLVLSLIHTPSPNYGFEKAMRFMVFNFFLFIITIMMLRRREDIIRLLYIIIIGTVLFSGLMLYEGFKSYMSGELLGFFIRFTVLDANPISAGRIIAISIAILLVVGMNIPSRRLRNSVLLLSSFLFIALLVTNTRGPVISLILGMGIFFLYFTGISIKKMMIYGFLLSVVLIITLLALPEQLVNRYFLLIGQEYGVMAQIGTEIDTRATRMEMWSSSLVNWVGSIQSFLIGHGTGSYASLSIFHDFQDYPHNVFLEIVFELGCVGLMLFLFHLGTISTTVSVMNKSGFKDTRDKIIFLSLVASAIVMFLAIQVSGDLAENRIFWIFLGMLVAFWRVTWNDRSSH